MTDLFGHTELQELREDWSTRIKHDGGHCPVCDRWGKVYPRSINGTMARSLCWLASREGWVDVPLDGPRWLVRSNQLPTLRWWGLVERQQNTDPHLKHSGMWRVTEKGQDCARNRIQVPKKVFTYNADPVDFGDDLTFIADCFPERFDYQAVMREFFE